MKAEMITEKSRDEGCIMNKYEMCNSLDLARATYYRMNQSNNKVEKKKQFSPRKLTEREEEKILSVLNNQKYCDMAPGEIYATLLDESVYLCSPRTMYRILERNHQNVQRRQKGPGNYLKSDIGYIEIPISIIKSAQNM